MGIYYKGRKLGEIKVTKVTNQGVNTTDATANAIDIAKGQVAYVQGDRVEGKNTLAILEAVGDATFDEDVDALHINDNNMVSGIYIDANVFISVKDGVIITSLNLKPENIKKGVTILGVTGTYEGGE